MAEFLKEVPEAFQFYREAPRTEDNALERELAPPDSMAGCSRNEHAVFGCGLVASPQLRSHGLAHGQDSSSADLELAPKGQSLISAGCLRSVYCDIQGPQPA
jgi:hypothetical protein